MSSHDTAAPDHPGNIGGVAAPRAYSYAGSVASSVATTKSHVTPIPAPSVASGTTGGGGMWETVGAAGPPVAKYGTPWGGGGTGGSSTGTSSYRSTSTVRIAPMDIKSNGWAKAPKVHKGKEHKWGEGNAADYSKEEGGEDEWAKYGRDIRDAKAGKVPKKKRQEKFDSDDD